MRISKAQPAARQRINIGRLDLATLTAVTIHVADAEVIREDENNIWSLCGVHGARPHQDQNKLESHEFVESKPPPEAALETPEALL